MGSGGFGLGFGRLGLLLGRGRVQFHVQCHDAMIAVMMGVNIHPHQRGKQRRHGAKGHQRGGPALTHAALTIGWRIGVAGFDRGRARGGDLTYRGFRSYAGRDLEVGIVEKGQCGTVGQHVMPLRRP
jgi:hypothetical protein